MQNEEIIITKRKEKPRQEKLRNWCSQTRLLAILPNANYQLEADRGGIRALSKCQLPSFNWVVLATRDWSWGNRVDKQLQTNNITKHSVKMVLLYGQMMTNALCTYTDLKPIMNKLSILLLWIAFLILLFWRRKTFESDHTIIARKRETQASIYWEGKQTKNGNPGQDPIDSRPLSVSFLFRTPRKGFSQSSWLD